MCDGQGLGIGLLEHEISLPELLIFGLQEVRAARILQKAGKSFHFLGLESGIMIDCLRMLVWIEGLPTRRP